MKRRNRESGFAVINNNRLWAVGGEVDDGDPFARLGVDRFIRHLERRENGLPITREKRFDAKRPR